MDFSFSDTQNELRELARKIIEDFASNERLKNIEADTQMRASLAGNGSNGSAAVTEEA